MPRKAKKKSLTKWLDQEVKRLSTPSRDMNYVIYVPTWAFERLLQEGCRPKESYDLISTQIRLPGGRAVRRDKSRIVGPAIIHTHMLDEVCVDISRFMPKGQTGARGAGEGGSPPLLVDGLSSLGQELGSRATWRVNNVPRYRPIRGGRIHTSTFRWTGR